MCVMKDHILWDLGLCVQVYENVVLILLSSSYTALN